MNKLFALALLVPQVALAERLPGWQVQGSRFGTGGPEDAEIVGHRLVLEGKIFDHIGKPEALALNGTTVTVEAPGHVLFDVRDDVLTVERLVASTGMKLGLTESGITHVTVEPKFTRLEAPGSVTFHHNDWITPHTKGDTAYRNHRISVRPGTPLTITLHSGDEPVAQIFVRGHSSEETSSASNERRDSERDQ